MITNIAAGNVEKTFLPRKQELLKFFGENTCFGTQQSGNCQNAIIDSAWNAEFDVNSNMSFKTTQS